jgi:hypothetical protein
VFETNVNVVKSLFQKHVIPSTMGPLMMNIGIGPDVDILNFRRDATFGTKVTSDRVDCETLLEADPVGAFLKREGVTDPARIKEAKERFPFSRNFNVRYSIRINLDNQVMVQITDAR